MDSLLARLFCGERSNGSILCLMYSEGKGESRGGAAECISHIMFYSYVYLYSASCSVLDSIKIQSKNLAETPFVFVTNDSCG